MIGKARIDGVMLVQHHAGQRHQQARFARHPIQEPAAGHVREQADVDFGHRDPRAGGDQPMAAGDRQSEAAAHGHAVRPGHQRLREGVEQVVQAIFEGEEAVAVVEAARSTGGDLAHRPAHVAPGTEALGPVAGQEDAQPWPGRRPTAPSRSRSSSHISRSSAFNCRGRSARRCRWSGPRRPGASRSAPGVCTRQASPARLASPSAACPPIPLLHRAILFRPADVRPAAASSARPSTSARAACPCGRGCRRRWRSRARDIVRSIGLSRLPLPVIDQAVAAADDHLAQGLLRVERHQAHAAAAVLQHLDVADVERQHPAAIAAAAAFAQADHGGADAGDERAPAGSACRPARAPGSSCRPSSGSAQSPAWQTSPLPPAVASRMASWPAAAKRMLDPRARLDLDQAGDRHAVAARRRQRRHRRPNRPGRWCRSRSSMSTVHHSIGAVQARRPLLKVNCAGSWPWPWRARTQPFSRHDHRHRLVDQLLTSTHGALGCLDQRAARVAVLLGVGLDLLDDLAASSTPSLSSSVLQAGLLARAAPPVPARS